MSLTNYKTQRGPSKSPRFYFTLLLLIAGYHHSFAVIHDSPLARLAVKHILHLEFDKSDALLAEMKRTEPDNNFRLLAENYKDFVRVNVSDDYRKYLAVKDDVSARIGIIEDEKISSPYNRWVLGDLYFQQGILQLKFGEYLSGARAVRKSLDLLSENKRQHPAFIYSYKYLGVMHAAISSIPPEYQWISSLLGISGSLEQGKNELQVMMQGTMETDPFVTEARMLYLFALMTFDNADNAYEKIDGTIQLMNKQNPLEAFFICSSLLKRHRNGDALMVLNDLNKSSFPYLHMLNGIAWLNKLEHIKASEEFRLFLSVSTGQNYVKAALLKLSWCELIDGDRNSYEHYLSQIPTRGSVTTDEDKVALNESKRNTPPNLYLLKARLLFDGGYLDDAYKLLKSSSDKMTGSAEKIEYDYRLGRILHQKEEITAAIDHYVKTLEKDTESKTWFPASAALQLGLIYEEQRDKAMAMKYYKLCLSLDPPEYKASLHQKAKAGMHRVG